VPPFGWAAISRRAQGVHAGAGQIVPSVRVEIIVETRCMYALTDPGDAKARAGRKAVRRGSANHQDGPVGEVYHLVRGAAKHQAGQVAAPF